MKVYTIFKVGYSRGIYGCTGEYFQAVLFNDMAEENDKVKGFAFYGLYGAEERVGRALEDSGYIAKWILTGNFGQLKGDERKRFMSEHQAIDYIKNDFREEEKK